MSARCQPVLLRFRCAPWQSAGEESSWAQWLTAVVGSVPQAWAGVAGAAGSAGGGASCQGLALPRRWCWRPWAAALCGQTFLLQDEEVVRY